MNNTFSKIDGVTRKMKGYYDDVVFQWQQFVFIKRLSQKSRMGRHGGHPSKGTMVPPKS